MNPQITIFWHRRDLRIFDNRGLFEALKTKQPVLPIFIFDSHILEELPENDARVTFIHQHLQEVQEQYQEQAGGVKVFHNTPEKAFQELLKEYNVARVITNKDYEPYAQQRDQQIKKMLDKYGVGFHQFKDHVILEENEVLKDDGKPYTVYTPYMKKWKKLFTTKDEKHYPSEAQLKGNLFKSNSKLPALQDLGFQAAKQKFPDNSIDKEIIANYHNTRNEPAIKGTSKLSVHLRFGSISIRHLVRTTREINPKYFNELIWRDFYQMILWHFPRSATESFKKKYDQIPWRNNQKEFEAWKAGKTGFPMVDAGMRELNQTGYMHNRVRMIVASFLTKHLLIDWRWGEAYFAEKLLDYEMGSNVGGWQWAAGSGVDAAPYFRIFNPEIQLKKFDPQLKYVRKWIKEFDELTYPQPIVDHKTARERCLKTFKEALS